MKIRALRLAGVGHFATPVALEGLSGGLDVLAGPNELGKSTLLRAMRYGLSEKYSAKPNLPKSDKDNVRVLQPYGGGASIVEVDFDAAGASWRIRKQFFSGASALLTNLATGHTSRNADAEAELERLLTAHADKSRIDLLWVEQGTSTAAVNPNAATQTTLRSMLDQEIKTIADGGAGWRILAAIAKELQRFVTPERGSPTGEYAAAIKARGQAVAADQRASERLAAARDRLDRLAATTQHLAAIASSQIVSQRTEALRAAEQRRDEAERARQAHERARLEAERARARLDQATQAHAAFEQTLSDFAAAEAAVATLGPQSEAEVQTLAVQTKALEQAESMLREANARKMTAETALRDAEAGERRAERQTQHTELTRRLTEARTHTAQSQHFAALIATARVTPDRIRDFRAIDADLSALAARRSARAPNIAIALAADASNRISVDGRPVTISETLSADRPVVLTIDGIGSITVTPAASADTDADQRREADQRAARDRLLVGMNVTTLAAAEALLVTRDQHETAKRDADATLKALAPHGLAHIEQEVARITAELAALLPLSSISITTEAARDCLSATSSAVHAAETSAAPLRAAVLAMRERGMTLAADLRHARERMTALAATLRDAAWRQDQLKALTADRAAAQAEHDTAVREVSSWRAALPDAATQQATLQAVEIASSAITRADGETQRLRSERAGLEGELSRDRDEDVGSDATSAQALRVQSEAKVADVENELAALRMIERELQSAEAASVDRVLAPALALILPYLERVFPNARLDLDDAFQPTGLIRAGAREDLSRLSLGTREQIAVIARLGFGRLLAERGAAVPLILDDALVYADDQRIASMFDLLQQAATVHQVIVLTCRERSFEALGGTRLELRPWTTAPQR